jgi:hypothetical protein
METFILDIERKILTHNSTALLKIRSLGPLPFWMYQSNKTKNTKTSPSVFFSHYLYSFWVEITQKAYKALESLVYKLQGYKSWFLSNTLRLEAIFLRKTYKNWVYLNCKF